MKKLFLLLAILAIGTINLNAFDRYQIGKSGKEFQEHLDGLNYVVDAGSRTLSGATTFYGYVTDLYVKSNGSDNSIFSISTGTVRANRIQLFNGEIYDRVYSVPMSSPSIIDFNIPSGTTVHYWISGYKTQQ